LKQVLRLDRRLHTRDLGPARHLPSCDCNLHLEVLHLGLLIKINTLATNLEHLFIRNQYFTGLEALWKAVLKL